MEVESDKLLGAPYLHRLLHSSRDDVKRYDRGAVIYSSATVRSSILPLQHLVSHFYHYTMFTTPFLRSLTLCRTAAPTLARVSRYTPLTTSSIYIRNNSNMSGSGNDQYSKEAAANPPLSQKLADLRAFTKKHKTLLFTTRDDDGSLHARVMAPAEITPDWKFRFIYDCESHKEAEVDNE